MDPLRDLCKIQDSFKIAYVKENVPVYIENKAGSPRQKRKNLIGETNAKIIIEKTDLPQNLAFPKIDSVFKNRDSLILADIDTYFNFSLQEDGYISPQKINPEYKYAILDTDKGFLEYLQYRLPASPGFTNCLDWPNMQFLNANYDKGLPDYVLGIIPEGLDLVVCNTVLDKKLLSDALKICKENGTFICKIDDKTDLQLLYTVAMSFNKFYLFKPFLYNLNENTGYLIAEEFTSNSLDILELESIKVPEMFIEYVENYYESFKKLRSEVNGEYNMYKCKALMNIY